MKPDVWLVAILTAMTAPVIATALSQPSPKSSKVEEVLGCVTLFTPIAVKLQSESMVPADCVSACSNYNMALISPALSHGTESLLFDCSCAIKLSNSAMNSTECTSACPGAPFDVGSPLCGGFDHSIEKTAWSVYYVPTVFELVALSPRDNQTCAEIYYQCGGVEWTGEDCCTSGAFCAEMNLYYWQCIPLAESTISATATGLKENSGLTSSVTTQVSPSISNSTATTAESSLSTKTAIIVGSSVGTIVFLAAGFFVLVSVYCRRRRQSIVEGTVDSSCGLNSAEFDGYLKLNGSNIILAGVNSKRNSIDNHAFDFEESEPQPSVAVLQQHQVEQHQQQHEKPQNNIITRLQTRTSKTEVGSTSPQKRIPRILLFESRTSKTATMTEDSGNHKKEHEKVSNNQIEEEHVLAAIRQRPPVTIGQNIILGAMRGNFTQDKSYNSDNTSLFKETAKSTPETATTISSTTRAALSSSPIDYAATNSENTKSAMLSSFLSYDLLIGGQNSTSTHASSLYMETIIRNDRIEFSNDDDGDV
ncbi:hypothetical protein HK100_008230 [Physocladia obscura]|uniref:CBM1 domain-containing protein n=1 Tax=Physocladia obscura TaxID=109957 RepID=A0AAD5T594_9FUNG|nr:hypothetical protein HK100_008230 [Physocladia obscura]